MRDSPCLKRFSYFNYELDWTDLPERDKIRLRRQKAPALCLTYRKGLAA